MPQLRRPSTAAPAEPAPPPQGSTGAAAVAVAGVAGTAAAATPAAAGAVAYAATTAAAARAAAAIVEGFMVLLRRRGDFIFDLTSARLREAAPDRPAGEIAALAAEEVAREQEFQRRMAERLTRDIEEALRPAEPGTVGRPTPEQRRARVQALLDRERRNVRQREEAMVTRSLAAVEKLQLQQSSPLGAYWELSPTVLNHSADCLAAAGRFWPWSALRVVSPPTHAGCFPAGTEVFGLRARGSTARWYAGELVELHFASGNRLSVTPNHPVLTPHGWVAAGELHEGSDVVRSTFGQLGVLGDPYEAQAPARIEDVAAAVGEPGGVVTVPVPVAAHDFHGDGRGSEISVVRADRLLVDDPVDASILEHATQDAMRGLDADPSRLAGQRSPLERVAAVGDASLRGMRGRGAALAGLGSVLREPGTERFAHRPDLHAVIDEARAYRLAADAVAQGQLLDRFAGQVLAGHVVDGRLGATQSSLMLAAFTQPMSENGPAHAEHGLQVLDLLAGAVSTDQVVYVDRRSWEGHVYNLETRDGWYAAGGVIVHNCPCRLRGLEEAKALGLMTDGDIPDEADALARMARIRAMVADLHEAGLTQDQVDQHAAWLLEEADRGDGRRRHALRYQRGTTKGGEFRPERGGTPGTPTLGGVVGRGMRRLAPRLPGRRGARWQWIRGRYTRIPEHGWERDVDGVKFTSPAGGTNVYREGELVAEPDGTPAHPDVAAADPATVRTPPRPVEVAAAQRRPIDKLREEWHAQGRARANGAIKANAPDYPPVGVAAGWEQLNGMQEAGFRPAGKDGDGRLIFAHPNGSQVAVGFSDRGRVDSIGWQPAPPAHLLARREKSVGPPGDFDAFAADTLALADEIGEREGAPVALRSLRTTSRLTDHAGERDWTGAATVGREVARDVADAARARRGGILDDQHRRGAWAAQWSATHEALHGVNPIDGWDYHGAAKALEEALTEEEAHRVAADRLADQGQRDVLRWRDRNPDAPHVAGIYRPERAALSRLLTEAGMDMPATRAATVRTLKYRTPPARRVDVLADALHTHAPDRYATVAKAADHVRQTLEQPGVPDRGFQSITVTVGELPDTGGVDVPAGGLHIERPDGSATAAQTFRAAGRQVNAAREDGHAARVRARDRDLTPAEAAAVLDATAAAADGMPGRADFPPEIRRELPPPPRAFDPRTEGIRLIGGPVIAEIASRALDGDADALAEIARRRDRRPDGLLADEIRAALPGLQRQDRTEPIIDPSPPADARVAAMRQPGERVAAIPDASTGIRLDHRDDGPFERTDTLAQHRHQSPGSGHLGSGVYFTSGADGTLRGVGADRHLAGVNLAGATLYRPRDENDGWALHDTLRDVNDLADSGGGEELVVRGVVLSRRRTVTDMAGKLPPFADGRRDERLAADVIRQAVAGHARDLDAGRYDAEKASTRVMRGLGYDGVDNRHLPALDTTVHGSVLYLPDVTAVRGPGSDLGPGSDERPVTGAVVNGRVGRWVWIRGRYTHIPHHEEWQEAVDGVRFRSPAGSTHVYRREGDTEELVARPRFTGHPDVRDPRRGGTLRDPDATPPRTPNRRATPDAGPALEPGAQVRIAVDGHSRGFPAEVLDVTADGVDVQLPNGEQRRVPAAQVTPHRPAATAPQIGPVLPDAAWETLLTYKPGDAERPGEIVPGVISDYGLRTPISTDRLEDGQIHVGPAFFDLDEAARAHQLRLAVGTGLFAAIDGDDRERTRLHGMWVDGRFSATDTHGRTVALDRYSTPAAVAEGYARLQSPAWQDDAARYPDALRYLALQADERGYPVRPDVLAWAIGQDVGGPIPDPTPEPDTETGRLAARLEGLDHNAAYDLLVDAGFAAVLAPDLEDGVYRRVTPDGVARIALDISDRHHIKVRESLEVSHNHEQPGEDPFAILATRVRGMDLADLRSRMTREGYTPVGSAAYGTGPRWAAWGHADGDRVIWTRVRANGVVDATTPDFADEIMRSKWRANVLREDPSRARLEGMDVDTVRRLLAVTDWQTSEIDGGGVKVSRVRTPDTPRATYEAYRLDVSDGKVTGVTRPGLTGEPVTEDVYRQQADQITGALRRQAGDENRQVELLTAHIQRSIAREEDPFTDATGYSRAISAMQRLGYSPGDPIELPDGGVRIAWWRRSDIANGIRGARLEMTLGPPADDGDPLLSRPIVSTSVTAGTNSIDRRRITGRMPANEREYRENVLGLADDLAERFGVSTHSVDAQFTREGAANAVHNLNGLCQWGGEVQFGFNVLPTLEAYRAARESGRPIDDRMKAKAYWCHVIQVHEVNHSVKGGAHGYSDQDGTRGIEEALTEETAHLLAREYLESMGLGDLADWRDAQLTNPDRGVHVVGTYQTYRTNFRTVLDRAAVPEADRADLMLKWKFQTAQPDVINDLAARTVAAGNAPNVNAALAQIRDTMAYTSEGEAPLRVDRFEPILQPANAARPPAPDPPAARFEVGHRVRVTPRRGRSFQGRVVEIGDGDHAGRILVQKIGRGERAWVDPDLTVHLDPADARPVPPARTPVPTTPPTADVMSGRAAPGAIVRSLRDGDRAEVLGITAAGRLRVRRADGSTGEVAASSMQSVAVLPDGREARPADTVVYDGVPRRLLSVDWSDPAAPVARLDGRGSSERVPVSQLTSADPLVTIDGEAFHAGDIVQVLGVGMPLLERRAVDWPRGGSDLYVRGRDGTPIKVPAEHLKAPPRPAGGGADPFDARWLNNLFTGTFGRENFKTVITQTIADPERGRADIEGRIYREDGSYVGKFQRSFWREPPDGEPRVYHALLELKRGAQGTGFASAFNQNAEAGYRQAGVKQVTVTANLDVGGYAWATTGFDFDGSEGFDRGGLAPEEAAQRRAAIASRLIEYARQHFEISQADYDALKSRLWSTGDPITDRTLQHAWDVAALGEPAGELGRRILIGTTWSGIKYL